MRTKPAIALVCIAMVGIAFAYGLRSWNRTCDLTSTRIQMGTVEVTIRVAGPDRNTCSTATAAAFDRIDQLAALLSDYEPDSEVSRISASAGKGPVGVSQETFEVTLLAQHWWQKSDGAFDPTIRPAIQLWKRAAQVQQLPTEEQLAGVRKLIGADKILFDREALAIGLPVAGMSLDLGGIAKGYVVDMAVEKLRAHGITSGVVNAGGDIYALGSKAGQAPWRIAVEIPPPAEERDELTVEYELVLALVDKAVATSGDYRRGFTINGTNYSHIINPRTAQPVRHVSGATVIAPDLTSADALATAVSVLGPADGIKLIELLPATEALILTREGAMLRAETSSGFSDYIIQGQDWLTELQYGNN